MMNRSLRLLMVACLSAGFLSTGWTPASAAAGRKAAKIDAGQAIAEQLKDALPHNLLIGEVLVPKTFSLPAGSDVRATWRKPPKEGHVFVLVEVVRKKKTERRLFVRVELLAIHDVLVAQRPLAEGDVIADGDLELAPRIGTDGVQLDPRGLIGSPVLGDLAVGDKVDGSTVGLPAPVARGSTVKALVKIGNARIEAQARLEATARPGERVRIRIASTHRMVTGVLKDAHTVIIVPGANP